MKSVIPFALLFLLLFASCTNNTIGSIRNSNTPQAAIENIFATIKENDTVAFRTLLATEKDYESFFHISRREEKEDTADVLPYVGAPFNVNNAEQFIRQFNKVRIDGMANGIADWKEVRFVRACVDTAGRSDQVMRPKAVFTYGEYVGIIHVGQCLIKTERGWVLASSPWMEFEKMIWMPVALRKIRRSFIGSYPFLLMR